MSRFLLVVLFLSVTEMLFAQRTERKLPYLINKPSWNVSHPYVSGDGQTLLFLTDYTDNPGLTMYWSEKKGTQWTEPKEVTRLVNRPDMNLEGAFSINHDGTGMIITSRKSGLGGFELWYSEKKNGDWQTPRNFGAPVNSNKNEGAGVFTTDGKGMYFMRCDQMNEREASGCKLYFTEEKYGRWQEPVVLPENVNQYNPQMPRILADEQTLIFSSNNPGGKGGFDLYVTRKTESGWEDPVNLEFANTPDDDQFVSAEAKGRYLYTTRKGERKLELVQILFPNEYKPKQVYRISGRITDEQGQPVVADLKVYDAQSNKRIINEKTASNGTYSLVLVEGSIYDFSLEPVNRPELQYHSQLYNLNEMPSRDKEVHDIVLKTMAPNKILINNLISFQEEEPIVADASLFEIRRIASYLRSNSHVKVEVRSMHKISEGDSLSAGLSQFTPDTLSTYLQYVVPSQYLQTSVKDTIYLSQLQAGPIDIADGAGALHASLEDEIIFLSNTTGSVQVPIYQRKNEGSIGNRALKEAEAVKNLLMEYGVEQERITTDGKAVPEAVGTADRWVEITFMD